jgi:hypothetical protein
MLETSATPPLPLSGRIVRAGLIILPLGTVLLGIASFGIWQWKRDRVEDRNLKHASALRQTPSPAGWERHWAVLKAVSEAVGGDRVGSVTSYLESSLGAESMGYDPRRFVVSLRDGQPVAGVLAELTGKKRPKEVVLVVMEFGAGSDAATVEAENRALASLLTFCHWLTGEPTERTLRFASLPVAGLDTTQRAEVLSRFGEEMRRRDERLMQVVDLSAEDRGLAAAVVTGLEMAARGARVRRENWPAEVSPATEGYGELRDWLLLAARGGEGRSD